MTDLKCGNCCKEECQDRKLLDTLYKFIPGTQLTVNKQNAYWSGAFAVFAKDDYTVVHVNGEHIIVLNEKGNRLGFFMIHKNVPTFLYKCK